MRIFIDVGGYNGHSTLAALDPIFGFDRIYCFEPVPSLAQGIREIADPRVVVIEAALSDRDGVSTLVHAGTLAGSLIQDAPSYIEEGEKINVRTVRASMFLPNLVPEGAFVRTKFNCEGAEYSIIMDILRNGSPKFQKQILDYSLIDFDIDKIPSTKGLRKQIEKELESATIKYLIPSECQYGMVSNYGGIRNYLLISRACIKEKQISLLKSIIYNLKMFRNRELNGYHKMRILRAIPPLRVFARSGKSFE